MTGDVTSVDVTGWDLTNLTITPPADSDVDFALTVTATSTEADGGDTAQTLGTIAVSVAADADAPTLSLSAITAAGDEDTSITLPDVTAALTDLDGSESLAVTIDNIPVGATLTSGTNTFTATAGNTSVDVTGWNLNDLAITPALNDSTDFSLNVTATATEADGGDTEAVSQSVSIDVAGVADTPTVTVNDAGGDEDTAIALDITAAVTDFSESLVVTIDGVPDGAQLNAGTNNGDGTWTLAAGDLYGLTIMPPANSDVDFTLNVTATSTDEGSTASSSASFLVSVDAVADAPSVTVVDASGAEDTAIPLDITAALTDADGSETLGIVIDGVPDGAVLSAGTNNNDGSWTLLPADLAGLTITPPLNDDSDFALTVKATTTEADGGDSAMTTDVLVVTVTGTADAPIVTVEDAAGDEDTAIALDITATLSDGTTGPADGAMFVLDEGSDSVLRVNADGSVDVIVTKAEISALTGGPVPDLDDRGIAIDDDGNIYFTDKESDSILMKPADGGDLEIAVSEADLIAVTGHGNSADPTSLTIGSDGKVYVIDGQADAVVSYDPSTGSVDMVASQADLVAATGGSSGSSGSNIDLRGDIVADDDGNLFFTTGGATDAVMTIDTASGTPSVVAEGTPFQDLDVYMSIAPNGDLIVADDSGSNSIHRVDPVTGDVTVFLSEAEIEAVVGGNIDLEGGIGFDADGNFYVAEENSDTIYVWNADDASAGTIDETSGQVFVTDTAMTAASGAQTDLEAGIAFGTDAFAEGDTLEVVIDGVPDGAILSAGTNNNDGSWTLTPADLEGLTITPAPDSGEDFTLTITAIATDPAGGTSETIKTLQVDVADIADTPTLTITDTTASGTEDTPIDLPDISASLTDLDGSEDLAITIDSIPEGATLTSGTNSYTAPTGGGSVDVTGWDLVSLTITPAADSDADFTLGVTATATEADGGSTALTSGSIAVSVAADADAPTLTLEATTASGLEDTAINLPDISAALTDADGSESLAISIDGIPAGATLTSGTNTFTATDGATSVDVTGWDLDNLTITPPADSDVDFTLGVTATSTEADGGDTASTLGSIAVSVAADADAPTLDITGAPAAGAEDTAIALPDISAALTDVDGSESLAITIDNIPEGATLVSGTNSYTAPVGGGSIDVTGWDLDALTVTPPANSDVDFTLGVTATSTDGSDTASTTGSIPVSVAADADAPTLTLSATTASGTEDTAITLPDITTALTDVDGSESLTVTISGVPAGATLSAGNDNGDGTWTIPAGNLTGLTVTPPANDDTDFTLTVTATATETENDDAASTIGTIAVSVAADADAPTLDITGAPAAGAEDTAIALPDVSAALTDGSETLSVTIDNIPEGATLVSGTNSYTAPTGGGSVDVTGWDLDSLEITPPANSDVDFTLGVTATSTDGSDTASTTGSIPVSVAADADAPTLTLSGTTASGAEDTAIELPDISAALTDVDGSESLAISIAGIPEGATLTSGTNTYTAPAGGGSVDVTGWDLVNLTITPAANDDSDFSLNVTATSTEADGGDTASTLGTIAVTVTGDADAPTLDITGAPAVGLEDTAIALPDITAALTDDTETLSVSIDNIPEGATLVSGTNTYTAPAGGGSVDVTGWDLVNLTITPPANSDVDFTLGVTATSTDGSDTATTTGSIPVSVDPDADTPTLTVAPASGAEDQPINLDITAGLTDTDGSEVLLVKIDGVPDGATLSAGTNSGGGTWFVSPAELTGLTITPAPDSDADFDLTVTATALDGESSATSTATFGVNVSGVADVPTVTVTPAAGDEDTAINLDISAAITDIDGSESLAVSIEDIPVGAVLTSGTNTFTATEGNTTADISGWDLTTLTITPPLNDSSDFSLNVTATASEDGTSASSSALLNVDVTGVADTPTVTVNDATGVEDVPIPLDITAAVTDPSEDMSVTITGVPNGAVLSAGTNNGNGSWTLTGAQLTGLTVVMAQDDSSDFTLGVTVTSTDEGSTASTSTSLNVVVAGVADTPTVTVEDASGDAGTPIALDLSAAITDADGSETLSITIDGVPATATLSAGTNNGDGSWTLTAAQLTDLTITPAAGDDTDLNLTVTATASEEGTTAEAVETLLVTVTDPGGDDPIVTVEDAAGNEDTAIALDITATLADGTTGTGEAAMYVLEEGADDVIKISPDGTVEIVVTEAEIKAATGKSDADLDDRGIVVDDDGNIYFTEKDSDSVLMKPADGGDVVVVASKADVMAATGNSSAADPRSLTIGSDGKLYIMDNGSDSIVSYDPATETVALAASKSDLQGVSGISKVNLEGGIVATDDGNLYFVSDASTDAVMSFNIDTGEPGLVAKDGPFHDLDVYMAVAPNGDLIVADDYGNNTIYRVDPDTGEISTFLSEEQIEAAVGQSVDLEGGISFDAEGNFYLAEENTDGVFKWSVDDASAGTIDVNSGEAFVSQADIMAVTGTDTDLEAGITFGPGDGSTLEVIISGVPDGAELSAGTDNGDGTWTLTPLQLEGLTITPPEHDDSDFTLTVTAIDSESNETTQTLEVVVTGVADEPTVSVADVTGAEDTAIPLDVSAALVDTDGSETLGVVIENIPEGATLTSGTNTYTAPAGGGSVDVTGWNLDNLTVTPATNDDSDFTLTLTATSTEGEGGTAQTSASFDVTVTGVADTPTVSVNDASGAEDTAIALDVSAALSDADGSETLSVTIDGVPEGASLSAGTNNGGGSWTLTAAQLNGLTLTPKANDDSDFSLNVTAISTEGDTTASSTTAVIDVTVAGVADAGQAIVQDATGTEDNWIQLHLDSAPSVDTDGSETLTITISDVPNGALLSPGTNNGDGTWSVSADLLPSVCILPPDDFSGDINMTLNVTTTEGDAGADSLTVSDDFTVTVTGVADTPSVSVSAASGNEDAAIPLDISAALADSSESLTITIDGVPSGATLSAGTTNGEGGWTLTPAQLQGLTITPAANDDTDFTLNVTAISADGDDTASASQSLAVTVTGVADTPTLTVADVTGGEDSAIALNIGSSLTDTDGSETLSVTIDGVPNGASLSAGTNNGGGSWTLTAAQLDGLTITPAANDDSDFTLNVTAISDEAEGGTASVSQSMVVTVTGVADTPTVSVNDASGAEDTPIALDISAAVADAGETLTVTIDGVPNGASLSAGTNNGGGSWTLTPAQLNGLTITPAANDDTDFSLNVTAISAEGDTTASSTTAVIDVAVSGVADAATAIVQDDTGAEDTWIQLHLDSAASVDTDGSETMTITISDVPNGALLSPGTNNGDGTWSVSAAQLPSVCILPPDDFSGDINMTLNVTTTEGDEGADSLTVSNNFTVTVTDVADTPSVSVSDASGAEDTAIALNVSAALTDASESLAVTITGVPDGATLSAGTNSGNGVWTVPPAQLGGLTITPPANDDSDFSLNVIAISTEADGTTATSTASLNVTVSGVADAPTLGVADAAGDEDAAIDLDISAALTDTDGSESLSITIDGVPNGAVLSAGSNNGDGSWTLTPAQLTDLTITPAANDDSDFTLNVTATSSEDDTTATTTASLDVVVAGVADTPTVTVENVSGAEDTAISLDITAAMTDTPESLVVTIDGVPNGATLSAGTNNGGGSWTLTAAQLEGLTITPPANDDSDFTLNVTATSTEGDTTASSSASFTVDVTGVADAGQAIVQDDTGAEDSWIQLHLDSAASVDTDGSETLTITISDVPNGALLSPGTNNGDGTWSVSAAELPSVCILPPNDFSGDINMTLNVTTTEGDAGADALTVSNDFTVTVTGVADTPTVTVQDATGTEDNPIDLNIAAALGDDSEDLSVTITGVPDGASLSAGTNNGNGSWTLTGLQLTGLTLIMAADDASDFTLNVVATATDGSDTATASTSLDVTVSGVADTPTVTVADVSGDADTAIALNISSAITDADGSEDLSVTIGGVPNGATLSAGTNNGDGTWTLTSAQLDGVTITPPSGDDSDFTLTVTATASEDGTTATATDTMTVTVADINTDAPIVTLSDATGTEDSAISLDIAATLADGTTGGGDAAMFILEEESDTVVKINADGSTEVVATKAEIMAATGKTNADLDDRGIVVDDDGNIFFSEMSSDSVLKISADDGSVSVVLSKDEIKSATGDSKADPRSLALDSDGNMYIMDAEADAILSYDISADSVSVLASESDLESVTGNSSAGSVDLKGGLVASDDGNLYFVSSGGDEIVMSVNMATGAPAVVSSDNAFQDLDVYIALAPNGDLIVADDGAQSLHRVDVDTGNVTDFLTNAELVATVGESVDLEGGIGFDADGNFYIAEENTDNVYVWDVDDASAGTIDTSSGQIHVSEADIASATPSSSADLEGGLTFGGGDGSSLEVVISGVPTGATLSAGTDNGDGTWTMTADQLTGLTITPPDDDASDFTLTVTATDSESNTTTQTLDVTVTGVADTPTVTVADAEGEEDTAISLDVSAALTDTDGSETLSVDISGVPTGSVLSAGTNNQDGSWTLTPAQLNGLTITPPAGDDSDFTLTVTATSSEDGTTSTATGSIAVVVTEAVAVPTTGDDTLTGTDGDDTIDALAGDDFIYGEDGDDTLSGGTGSDYLSGGADDDTLNYSADATWGSGDMAVNTETGQTVELDGYNRSTDVFDGGTGNDTLSLSVGDDAIFLDDRYSVFPDGEGPRIASIEAIHAGAGNDLVDLTSNLYEYGDVTINGEAGDDTLWSGAGDDTLDGGADNDILFGGEGNDTLNGGSGDDTIYSGFGDNVIDGGTGTDTVDYSESGVAVKVRLDQDYGESRYDNSFDDTLTGIENVTGSDYDDYIKGDSGDNLFEGGAGDDTLIGGSGADMLYGGDDDDTVKGGSGADLLYGGEGLDTIEGGGGNDYIYGEEGDDDILGGGGHDIIVGGLGDDTLTGGRGDDTFQFNALDELGDTITDFGSGNDSLAFDGDVFVVAHDEATGLIDATEFESVADFDTSAPGTSAAFVFDESTNDLYFDQTGNGQGYTLVANIEDGVDETDIQIMS